VSNAIWTAQKALAAALTDAGVTTSPALPERATAPFRYVLLDTLDPGSIFVRWLKAASLAGNPQKLAQGAMVTATCGLGLLDPSSVAASFGAARGVGKLIRALAGEPYAEGS